jgi:hypothetical protein
MNIYDEPRAAFSDTQRRDYSREITFLNSCLDTLNRNTSDIIFLKYPSSEELKSMIDHPDLKPHLKEFAAYLEKQSGNPPVVTQAIKFLELVSTSEIIAPNFREISNAILEHIPTMLKQNGEVDVSSNLGDVLGPVLPQLDFREMPDLPVPKYVSKGPTIREQMSAVNDRVDPALGKHNKDVA